MGTKKNKGSSDDVFGDLEDSFFASGEDDTFWDDEVVNAYEDSMAIPKKELERLKAELEAQEAAQEAAQKAAPDAAPDAADEPIAAPAQAEDAPAVPAAEALATGAGAAVAAQTAAPEAAPDRAPAAPAAPPAPRIDLGGHTLIREPEYDDQPQLEGADSALLSSPTADLPPPTAEAEPAPAPAAASPAPLPDFFRMAPPRPSPSGANAPKPPPASAPDKPADSALFSAPTLIMAAGGGPLVDDDDDDEPIAAAPAAAPTASPEQDFAPPSFDNDATEELPRPPGLGAATLLPMEEEPEPTAALPADDDAPEPIAAGPADQDAEADFFADGWGDEALPAGDASDADPDDGASSAAVASVAVASAAVVGGSAAVADASVGAFSWTEGDDAQVPVVGERGQPELDAGVMDEGYGADVLQGSDLPDAPTPPLRAQPEDEQLFEDEGADVEDDGYASSGALGILDAATEEYRPDGRQDLGDLDEPFVPAPVVSPAMAEPAPLAVEAAAPRIRYEAAAGDGDLWREAATSLQREARAADDPAQRGALLGAAGAIRFRHLGEWEQAESLFEQAIQAGAETPDLLRCYADAAASRGDFMRMRSLLEKRARMTRGTQATEALHDIALVERNSLRRPEEAVAALQQALEIDAQDWFALRLLQEMHFRSQSWEALVQVLDQMAEVAWPAASARLRVERGRILAEELHRSEDALESWRLAQRTDPSSAPAFLALENGLEQAGAHNELVALYRSEAERLGGADGAFYLARAARLAISAGLPIVDVADVYTSLLSQPEAAISRELRHEHQAWLAQTGQSQALADSMEAEAAALKAPDDALPLYRLARVQEKLLGDSDLALASYQRVVASDPTCGPAAEATVRLLQEQGRHAETIAFLKAHVAHLKDPNLVVTTLYRMGEICEGPLDDLPGARTWFERILDTAPGYLPALEGLERVYTRLAAWPELAAVYEQRSTLAEAPAAIALFLHRAGSTHENRLKDATRARDFYRRALDAVADFPPSLDAYARLLADADEWASLARVLADAADSSDDPNEVVSLRYRSARIYADRTDAMDMATVQLRMCLELSPGFLPAIGLMRSLAHQQGDDAAVYQLHLQEAGSTGDLDRRHWQMLAAAEAAEAVEGADPAAVAQQVLAQDPHHRGAIGQLEDRALRQGDSRSLIGLYRALASNPQSEAESAVLAARIADVAGTEGDVARSMQALSEVLAAEGPRPLRALARLAEGFGYWEEALRALEALDAADGSIHAEVARIRESWQEDPAAALAAWQAASQQLPGDIEAASGLERALARLGERDGLAAAHEQIARGVEEPGIRGVHAVLAAHLYSAAGEDDAAEAAYRLAFDARPERGRAFDALVDRMGRREDTRGMQAIFDQLGDATLDERLSAEETAGLTAPATQRLSQAISDAVSQGEDPSLDILVRAERAAAAAGDWRAAFDTLARRRGLSADPEERAAIDAKRRWILAEKLADSDEAWDFYRQLHEEAPEDAEVLEALARIAGARGESGLAIQYLDGLASVTADASDAARYRRRVAEVHLANGDRDAARGAFLAALDHNPEDLESLTGLKRLAEDSEDWRALVGVLAREANVVEGDEQILRYRAIATTWEERIGEPQVAMDAWRKVLDLRPEDADALEHLVALARSREDWQTFVDVGQARLRQLDGRDRTRLQAELGRVFFKRLYREDEAVRFLDAATGGEHPDSEAAELLERIYAARGQWDLVVEAIQSHARAVTGQERVDLLLRAAQTRSETLHDRDGAASIYAKVLEEQPLNSEALRFRGDWLYNAGELVGAVEVFEAMEPAENERDVDDFDVRIEVALYYFRFAEALRKLKRTADALGRYEQGLKLNPSHLPSLEAVGPLFMDEERWDEAGNVYRRILQLTGGQGDPLRLARTYVNLGRVELHQGNLDKAKKRFNKALDLRANDIKALQGIAAVLFARKDWNNLLNVHNNIIYHAQEPSEVVEAYLTKGYVLDARLDLADKAQQHYEKSLAFDPAQPKALLRLAELALRKQDWPEAASLADRGLSLEVDEKAVEAGLHLVRCVAYSACGDEAAASAAFSLAMGADVTLTDKLGDKMPAWDQMHAILKERLQARL